MASNQTTLPGAVYNLPVFVNPTAEKAVPTASGGSVRAVLSLNPAPQQTTSPTYLVRARGTVTTAGSYTNTLNLRFNSGPNTNLTTFTNDTLLATSGAVTIATSTVDFELEAKVTWSAASGTINCWYQGNVGATLISQTVCSNIPVAAAANTNLQFILTDVFGTSNAGNSITVSEFSADPN
jgi:hypothetical protein